MDFHNQTALVTGGGGGIGGAVAQQLIRQGARVAILDIKKVDPVHLTEEMQQNMRSVALLLIQADVSAREQVNSSVGRCVQEWGRIDILVNCAGGALGTPRDTRAISDGDWDLVLDVNLKGTFLMCQACLPIMQEKRYGRIVNIASIAGRAGGAVTGVHYAAAKGGIIALTKHLAREFGGYGITVNASAPGLVLSGDRLRRMWERLSEGERSAYVSCIPLQRISTVEEQVAAIVFLASPAASFINGAILDVNGGVYSA